MPLVIGASYEVSTREGVLRTEGYAHAGRKAAPSGSSRPHHQKAGFVTTVTD